jgi:hypothetical protein
MLFNQMQSFATSSGADTATGVLFADGHHFTRLWTFFPVLS